MFQPAQNIDKASNNKDSNSSKKQISSLNNAEMIHGYARAANLGAPVQMMVEEEEEVQAKADSPLQLKEEEERKIQAKMLNDTPSQLKNEAESTTAVASGTKTSSPKDVQYESDGHYWTIYALCLNLGLSDKQCIDYAVASELYDNNVSGTDVVQGTEFKSRYTHLIPWLQGPMHAFGGTQKEQIETATKEIDEGNLNSFHRLGDAFAHANSFYGYEEMYPIGLGHKGPWPYGGLGNDADNIKKHKDQYFKYVSLVSEKICELEGIKTVPDLSIFKEIAKYGEVEVRTRILQGYIASKIGQGFQTEYHPYVIQGWENMGIKFEHSNNENGHIIAINRNLDVQAERKKLNKKEVKPKQGKLVQRRDEEELQMKSENKSTPDSVSTSHTTTQMPEAVQAKMENSFGTSFAGVNIHQNDSSATQMNALAYTQGNNVHFAPGQYNPNTQSGQELLGHELTHVVQQKEGKVKPTSQAKGMSVNDSPSLENEADVMGKQAAEGKPVYVHGNSSGIQKQEAGANQGQGDIDDKFIGTHQLADEAYVANIIRKITGSISEEFIPEWLKKLSAPILDSKYIKDLQDFASDKGFDFPSVSATILIKAIDLAEYKYDKKQGIFFTTQDAYQQYGGYADLYDKVANYKAMFRIDHFKIPIHVKGKNGKPDATYNIRGWKGNYWGAAGAEIGCYADDNALISLFSDEPGTSASKKFMLEMGFILKDSEGKEIFTRYKEENWWVIGLKPLENKTWEDMKGKYTMEAVIDFKKYPQLMEDFVKTANGSMEVNEESNSAYGISEGEGKDKKSRITNIQTSGTKVVFKWK